MDSKNLVVERIYEAPIERVWKAITDKDQMKSWYFDVSDFKPEVGFEFQFYGESDGKKYLHKCTVVESNPITKIAYTWAYDGYTGQSTVTFELLSQDKNHTKVKLTHSGLDSFPKDNPDFNPENFNMGWNAFVGDSLRKFVEMGTISQSIQIRANLKDIWDIVLNPDHQYGTAFGGGAFVETDWSEGSYILWRDTAGDVGANGIVEVHQPDKYLQLHYYDNVEPKSDEQLGEYYEKFTLEGEDGEAVLTIEAGRIAKYYIPTHQGMWDNAMEIIKELAEKK